MSPAHFRFGPSAEKSWSNRLGAMLKVWLLSVVTLDLIHNRRAILGRGYPYPFDHAVFKFRFARAPTFLAIMSAWPLLR